MKLRTKMFIIISAVCVSFIALGYFIHSFKGLAGLAILSAFILIGLTYGIIIKRIEQLYQFLVKKNGITLDKDIQNTDEIARITMHIQQLFKKTLATQTQLEHVLAESAQKIKTVNQQLQQERLKTREKHIANDKSNLSKLAHYDSLTSLPNRIFFNQILNKTISHAKRRDKILAILCIDIDQFKKINTEIGYALGDLILKEIGSRLANTLRAEDILARFNGDEFIVLLNDIGKPKFASTVARKIQEVCKQPVKVNGHEFVLTMSIGISIYPDDGNSLEDLLKHVDSALYNAQVSGGDCYQFYSQAMDVEAHEFIKLESNLRNALTQNELVVFYQPKLHIKKGKITGVEALMRWNQPEFGMILPAKFIAIAEETGLMMPITAWLLHEVCKTAIQWQEEGYEHLTIALNLSPSQFNHADIVPLIARILRETKLNPKYLELEVNESIVMENIAFATNRLFALKEIGILLSIDHFGTGYTSISHLKQFPVSAIKIDRNFIKGVPQNPNDTAITNALIALAHQLGLEVVAEGVETAEQVQYLAQQQCDLIQGYYLSHPLPAKKVASQFKKLEEEVMI